MGTGKTAKYVAIGSVVAVIGLFAWVAHESRMLSYLSSDSKVCINCHTMNTHFATWQHSSHREWAVCADCHLPRDSFLDKVIAKARDGYNHSVAMTFGTYGDNLRISDDAGRRIQKNCVSCHSEAVSQMLANARLYHPGDAEPLLERKCWDCHRGLPHGRARSLSAAHGNLGVKEL